MPTKRTASPRRKANYAPGLPAPSAKNPAAGSAKPPAAKKPKPVNLAKCKLSPPQLAAVAILLAGLPLPAKLRGVLPVNVEAKARTMAKNASMGVLFTAGEASIFNEAKKRVVIQISDIVEGEHVIAGAAPAPITRADMDESLRLGLDLAWGIIANSGNPPGDWHGMPEEWQTAARAWRDKYLKMIYAKENQPGPRRVTIPEKFTLGGQVIKVVTDPELMAPHSPKMGQCDPTRGVILIQTPTAHYRPSRGVVEKVYVHEKVRLALHHIGRPELLKDAALVENLAAALHQIEATQTGDLDVLLDVEHVHGEE